jgi:hypothetical protein
MTINKFGIDQKKKNIIFQHYDKFIVYLEVAL